MLKIFIYLILIIFCLWLVVVLYERLFVVGKVYTGQSMNLKEGVFVVTGVETTNKKLSDILKWNFGENEKVDWVESYTSEKITLNKISGDKIAKATFINHSTVFIQTQNLNILTDPVFTQRASPFTFAGPKRHHDPYVALQDLQKVDVVLISHGHYDHMSLDTIKEIEKMYKPIYILPLNNGQFIERVGVEKDRIVELDIYENKNLGDVKITLEKAQHWSMCGFSDRNRYLWGSYMIEVSDKKIYFAGDSGYGKHYKEIQDKYRKIDLSLIPIGAYEPRWFMKEQHMNSEDALQAAKDLNTDKSMGIHFGTFQLTDEGRHDPEKSMRQVLEKDNYTKTFLIPTVQNGLEISI